MAKKEQTSGWPQLGYSSKRGVSIQYKHNLSLDLEAGYQSAIALDYYGKKGFFPRYQAEKETSQGKGTLIVGKELDKDNKPLEMLPYLAWQTNLQDIPGTSWSYTWGGGVGHFAQPDHDISTWRTTGNLKLANQPISLGGDG